MDARISWVAWIAPPLMAGCAAPTIDLASAEQAVAQARTDASRRDAPAELAARARVKLSLGKRYLDAGEEKLGGFLVEQARVDAELASLKAATLRLRAEALERTAARP